MKYLGRWRRCHDSHVSNSEPQLFPTRQSPTPLQLRSIHGIHERPPRGGLGGEATPPSSALPRHPSASASALTAQPRPLLAHPRERSNSSPSSNLVRPRTNRILHATPADRRLVLHTLCDRLGQESYFSFLPLWEFSGSRSKIFCSIPLISSSPSNFPVSVLAHYVAPIQRFVKFCFSEN